jgi:ABC-type transporter Mla maintaining outer membrane lipid asymmetry ATPase subunit MlaF
MAVYDFKTRRLLLNTLDGISYDLELNGNIAVVGGDSGTGKTFLCKLIKERKKLAETSSEVTFVGNIEVFDLDSGPPSLDVLKALKNKLVVIDEADILLDGSVEVLNNINDDYIRNHYLIFSRGGIHVKVTPAHCASFVVNDGCVRLDYSEIGRGWAK